MADDSSRDADRRSRVCIPGGFDLQAQLLGDGSTRMTKLPRHRRPASRPSIAEPPIGAQSGHGIGEGGMGRENALRRSEQRPLVRQRLDDDAATARSAGYRREALPVPLHGYETGAPDRQPGSGPEPLDGGDLGVAAARHGRAPLPVRIDPEQPAASADEKASIAQRPRRENRA
jgi:hypothetical protein